MKSIKKLIRCFCPLVFDQSLFVLYRRVYLPGYKNTAHKPKKVFMRKQSKLNRKFFPAFFTPAPNNAATANRSHSRAKPVFIFSFSLTWLICSFHDVSKKAWENTKTRILRQNQKEKNKTGLLGC